MSFSRIDGGTNRYVEFNNSAGPLNITKDTGSASNDYAIIAVSWYQGGTGDTITTPTGFTKLGGGDLIIRNYGVGQNAVLTVFGRLLDGSEAANYPISFSFPVYGNAVLTTFRSTNGAITMQQALGGTPGASVTNVIAPSVTGTSGELLVAVMGTSDPGGTWGTPSGMTAGCFNASPSTDDVRTYFQTLGSSGATGTRTATISNSRDTLGVSIRLSEPAGGSSAALAGAPAAVATATGAITTKVAASGASLAVSTASGTISTAIRLAGPVSVISTPAAAATTKIAGAGLSAAVSSPSASLTAVINVAGGSLAQTVVSAALSTILRVIGNSSASVTATGQLTAPVSLAVLSPAEAKAWATLSAYGPAAADGQIAADLQTNGITTETDGYLGAVFPVVVAGDAVATATATGALINWSSFTLGWTAVAGATGYRIKVGTSSGVYDPARQVDVGPTILTYAIGGLFPGVTYYFTIVALDSGGNEGVAAPEISGIGDPPGAPHVLTGAIISAAIATATLNTEIKLAGTAQALATVVAALNDASTALSGNISAQAIAAANLSTKIATSGSVIDVTTVTGALNSASAALAGFVSAQTTLGGDIEIAVDVAGDSGAISSMTGSLLSVIAAEGHSIADVTITGNLSGGSPVVIEEHPSGGWGHYGDHKKRKKPEEYLPTKDEVKAERIKLGIIPDEKQIKAEKQKEIVSRLSMTRKQIKESNAAFLASVSQAENTEMAYLLWKSVISDEEAIASIIAELI